MLRDVLSEVMDSVLRGGGPGVMNGTLSDASSETMADVLVLSGADSEGLEGVLTASAPWPWTACPGP